MHSRLHEMCEFLEFDGADYRHLPPNGGVDDLLTHVEARKKTPAAPHAAAPRQGPVRAQLREPDARRQGRTSRWPGGQGGT